MINYYEILEVDADAETVDIKKAYFRKVKKYTPEREPEKFKEIRNAYEFLSNQKSRAQYDELRKLGDADKRIFDACVYEIQKGYHENAFEPLKYLIKKNPGLLFLNSFLGEAYIANGNTGNGVKIFEELVKLEADNASYVGKLAHAYLERGYTKKAVAQYQKAIKLDPYNLDLWKELFYTYASRSEFRDAAIIIKKAIHIGEENGFINQDLYFNGAFVSAITSEFDICNQYIDKLENFKTDDDVDDDNKAYFFIRLFEIVEVRTGGQLKNKIRDILERLHAESDELKERIHEIVNGRAIDAFYGDAKISDSIKAIIEVVDTGCGCEDCRLDLFYAEIEVADNLERLRKEIIHMKQKHPVIYEMHAVFFNKTLSSGNENILNSYMQKKHDRFMKNPHYSKNVKEDYDDDFDDYDDFFTPQQPFVRDTPKAGRNDPCPCGSGKKYKKCCGA